MAGLANEIKALESGALEYPVTPLHEALLRAKLKNILELKRAKD